MNEDVEFEHTWIVYHKFNMMDDPAHTYRESLGWDMEANTSGVLFKFAEDHGVKLVFYPHASYAFIKTLAVVKEDNATEG